MRVFIGIKIDKSVIDRINKLIKPVKKISSPLKWVKNSNIHITLKFIGEINQEKCRQLENELSGLNSLHNPFEIELTGFGKFGKNNNLNILWAGIETNPDLENLFNDIEARLAILGIEKEKRDFKPHITLARNKKLFNFSGLLEFFASNRNLPISKQVVSSFQICQSDLHPDGPVYKVLKEISIGNT